MSWTSWTFAVLLGCIAQSSAFPRLRDSVIERDIAAGVAPQADVVLSSHATLEELAKELYVDFGCVSGANPQRSHFSPGDLCYVPYHCCKTSCKGFCSRRTECYGHSVSSAPAQPTGTSTTCVTTITTSIPNPTTTSSTVATTTGRSTDSTTSTESPSSASSSASGPPGNSSSGNVTGPTTTLSGSSGSETATDSGSTAPLTSTVVTSSEPAPTNSTVTDASSPGTTTGTAIVTTTNSLGQTIISDISGAVILPSGVSTSSLVTLPDGSVVTFQPTTSQPVPPTTLPGGILTTTDSLGQTVISDTSGAITIPSGLSSTSVLTLPGGTVVTFQPTESPASPRASITGLVTTTNSDGQTVISDASGAATIPSDISTASVVTLPDGSTATFIPSSLSTGSGSGTAASSTPEGTTTLISPSILTTTNSDGLTIISDSSGALTLPTGITTGSVLTLPGGSSVTFEPTPSPTVSLCSISTPVLAGTNSDGLTIISDCTTAVTIPASITSGSVFTLPDGAIFTLPTASPTTTTTSDVPTGFIFPVTTSVDAPKATDGGTVIPCNLWFFSICIDWINIDIGGWEFDFPEGIRHPGPPPAITFPPSLSITVEISGTLPPWPSLTIGPDRLPTFEPEPDNCQTKSAELCLTSTSFGVDTATVTTASSVLSTCATVFGCDVTDSATSTSTTSSAASTYLYSCTPGCAVCAGGVAKRALPTAIDAPSPLVLTAEKSVFTDGQFSELDERDIPSKFGGVSPSEFYLEEIGNSPNTALVPLDSTGLTGFTSSVYEPFNDAERNIYLTGLRGCTSVVVVSRRGAWVSHFWEGAFATDRTNPNRFQTDVLDYLENGRAGESGTQSLLDVTQSGIFADTATTKIFIMTPATYDRDLLEFRVARTVGGVTIPQQDATPENEQTASLQNSDAQPLFDGTTTLSSGPVPDRLTPLKNQLAEILPGVEISQFTYRRQQNEDRVRQAAYGKLAVLYSNNQEGDPNDPLTDIGPPQQAVWECWMQDFRIGSDRWNALPAQECGGQSGNQKRQDGGACSLSSTATSTSTSPSSSTSPSTSRVPSTSTSPSTSTVRSTSTVPSTSSSPQTSTITSTSSAASTIDPSTLPTLPCSVPMIPGDGVFYVFTESYRECSEGGLCSDSLSFVGLATDNDAINNFCDFFTGRARDLFSENSYDVEAPYPPNVNFTIEHTGAYCNTNPLTFDLQCDGSWYVTGEGQGGSSLCTSGDVPEAFECSGAPIKPVLVCRGAICG